MEKTGRKGRRRFIKLLAVYAALSLLLGAIKTLWPGEVFIGSEPRRHDRPQNKLNLRENGAWWGKLGKAFRPSGYADFFGPAMLLTPVIHHFAGWDVYCDFCCVKGDIYSMHVSFDDGDVGLVLNVSPAYAGYAYRRNHPEDARQNFKKLIVEIDFDIRPNFPIVTDLSIRDTVIVCGRWVYDRGHDHNEIHPARWMEIIGKKTRS